MSDTTNTDPGQTRLAGPTRWPGLDGLRGCAVIAVVLFHLDVLVNGFLGVDVFFVLSGFLITTLVLAEHERTGTVSLRRFFLRRSLRLYPPVLVTVVFFLAVAVGARAFAGRFIVADVLHDAGVAVLYVANLSSMPSGLLDHTWTLALEEQFYLVWPALLLVALKCRGRRWAFAPALMIVAL